jgi:hypothetical protein
VPPLRLIGWRKAIWEGETRRYGAVDERYGVEPGHIDHPAALHGAVVVTPVRLRPLVVLGVQSSAEMANRRVWV